MTLFGPYLMGAALLVLAGAAKVVRPADTARALRRALGGPSLAVWTAAVRVGAAAEAVVGVAAAVHPSPVTAAAVAVSYVAFTAFVLRTRATGGPLATCGCFGSPDTPPTLGHAGIDLLAALAATGVAVAGPDGWIGPVLAGQPYHGVALVAASALATWLAFLVLVPLTRLQALRATVPVPHLDGPAA